MLMIIELHNQLLTFPTLSSIINEIIDIVSM